MAIGRRIYPDDSSKENLSSQQKTTQLFQPSTPRYSFDEIILAENTKNTIEQALVIRDHSDIVFEQWGLKHTHKHSKKVGINLYGPPGTGKTMVAHAIAHHFQQEIIVINYADIESKFVGETPKNLTKAFETAKATNSILFFDEADAILSRRVTNMSNATDTSVNQTRSVMLTLLNDFDGIILFATNYISNFDPAFMRRILAHIEFQLPDLAARRQLLHKLIPATMPHTIRTEELATISEGLSGSDISNAILLAAFAGAKSVDKQVSHEHVVNALEGIRKSLHANAGVQIEKKIVTEDYVRKSLGLEKDGTQ